MPKQLNRPQRRNGQETFKKLISPIGDIRKLLWIRYSDMNSPQKLEGNKTLPGLSRSGREDLEEISYYTLNAKPYPLT